MGSFSATSFSTAAAGLPAGLSVAIRRDLKISPSQYLAESAAATRAVQVVASLKSVGVDVLGSSIDGTQLTVNIADAADSSTVQEADATPVVGAPVVPNYKHVDFKPVSTTTLGGEGYAYQDSSGDGYRCSIGFNGYNGSTGAPEFATAGHCETAIAPGSSAYLLTQNAPAATGAVLTEGSALGTAVTGAFGNGNDYGIISSADAGISPQNSIATWGGSTGSGASAGISTGAPTASTVAITGEIAATDGAPMCKSGASSGYTCGTIEDVDDSVDVSGHTVNEIVATTCLLPGDSGGGAIVGTSTAVAIDSGTDSTSNTSCTNAVDANGDPAVYVFYPLVSANNSNSVSGQLGAAWQIGVAVSSTATVTAPTSGSNVSTSTVMTGTITGATASSTALLYLDGSTTPFAKANASTGSWSIPLTGISPGTHTYSLSAGLGWSPGTPVTGSFTVVTLSPPAVTPAVATCLPITQSSSLTGTLANPTSGATVSLFLNGSTTATATASASTGSWSLPLTGIANGTYTYTVTATYGAGLTSAATAGTLRMSDPSAGAPAVPTNPTPTEQAEAYVCAMYKDVLDRSPAPGEITGWAGQILAGEAPVAVAEGFVNSDEYRLLRINAAYQNILGRTASAGEAQGWLQAMKEGKLQTDDVDKDFYASQEFFNKSGPDHLPDTATYETYVNALYVDLIGRTASPAEQSGWGAIAEAQGYNTVVQAIWNSIETARSRVTIMYQTYLGRTPAPGEVDGWADISISQGDAQVRWDIIGSQEYWNDAWTRFPDN